MLYQLSYIGPAANPRLKPARSASCFEFLDRNIKVKNFWSGRRGSNPRPTAWKAVTLPLSYSRQPKPISEGRPAQVLNSQRAPNPQSKFFGRGGQGRIRTPVARKERQIYSLLPLATRPPVRFRVAGEKARWGAAFSRAFFFAWFRGSLIATGLTHSPMPRSPRMLRRVRANRTDKPARPSTPAACVPTQRPRSVTLELAKGFEPPTL